MEKWEDDDGAVAADPVADPSSEINFNRGQFLSLEVTIKKGEMRGADGIQIEASWHIISKGSLE